MRIDHHRLDVNLDRATDGLVVERLTVTVPPDSTAIGTAVITQFVGSTPSRLFRSIPTNADDAGPGYARVDTVTLPGGDPSHTHRYSFVVGAPVTVAAGGQELLFPGDVDVALVAFDNIAIERSGQILPYRSRRGVGPTASMGLSRVRSFDLVGYTVSAGMSVELALQVWDLAELDLGDPDDRYYERAG